MHYAYDLGARVRCNPWGSGAAGAYTWDAPQVDSFVWDDPSFLPVFAAGDDGHDARWLEPATPQDAEPALGSSYEQHASKVSETGSHLRSVVPNLRRDEAAAGTPSVELWDWCPGYGPVCYGGSFGSVDVSELSTAEVRPVEFTGDAWPGGPEQWVHLIWTSRTGAVYVGCNASGSGNYACRLGDGSWSIASNCRALQLVTGDGVVDPGSVGAPATAKNCLAVGASETSRLPNATGFDSVCSTYGYTDPIGGTSSLDDPGGMAALSSRGPTSDGHYKPDLVAPGTCIAACRSQRIPQIAADDVEQGTDNFSVGTDWARYDPPPDEYYQPRTGSRCYRGRGTGGEPRYRIEAIDVAGRAIASESTRAQAGRLGD